MSSNVLTFERFDDNALNGSDARAQQERAAQYAEGFAAGEAAALARAMEQNQQLKAVADAVAKKLTSIDEFIAAQLCDALADAIKKVFPALGELAFADESATEIKKLAALRSETGLTIKTAPGKSEAVRKAIETLEICERTTVEEDPALAGLQVSAEWQHGGVTFDTEAAIARLTENLNTAAQQLNDESEND